VIDSELTNKADVFVAGRGRQKGECLQHRCLCLTDCA
jgi:hypothetical protein